MLSLQKKIEVAIDVDGAAGDDGVNRRGGIPPAKGGRHRIRNVGVALCSLLVLVGFGSYLLAPTGRAFAIDVSAGQSIATSSVVLYGEATDFSGAALPGVQINVNAAVPPRVLVATITSGSDGTFRVELNVPDGPYLLSFVSPQGQQIQNAKRMVRLAAGHAYRVDVKTHRYGGFWFFPAGSY
jgi:hypothetical protein